jgi:hypothetical protein
MACRCDEEQRNPGGKPDLEAASRGPVALVDREGVRPWLV